jgi:hypothetical protein
MVDTVSVINDPHHSAIGWGAVTAGALVAAAILFLLLAFGTSVGLSAISPWAGHGAGAKTMGLLAAGWFLVTAAGSFWLGGYLAGRMRIGWDDLSIADARARDGIHGLVVWAVGVVFFIWLGLAAAASVAVGGAAAASATDADAYTLDTLFRAPSAERPDAIRVQHRTETARILARSVGAKPLPAEDRSYLVRIVAADTGIPMVEAETRVDQAITDVKSAADAARKAAVYGGFLTVSGLFIAAAASWGGAIRGGKQTLRRATRALSSATP